MVRVLPPKRRQPTAKERRRKADRIRARLPARKFTDPFPEVDGTDIEKMIYAELMRRGIPFEFQKYVNFNLPLLETNRWHRADFVVADSKIIINPLGYYWHVQPSQIDKDATVIALAQLSGWTYLSWWDFEIKADLQKLFDAVPALRNRGAALTKPPPNLAGKDDSRGIRTVNRRRYGRYQKRTVLLKGVKQPGGRKPRKPRKIKAYGRRAR